MVSAYKRRMKKFREEKREWGRVEAAWRREREAKLEEERKFFAEFNAVPNDVTVDEFEQIRAVIDEIQDLPTSPPSLYCDIEGVNLGRTGTISIIQIFGLPRNMIYLIDILKLGEKAFQVKGSDGETTLKTILESKSIPKCFWDVRMDSDALWNLFGIKLGGIIDVQLMEVACRNYINAYLIGFGRCIEHQAGLPDEEVMEFLRIKGKGKQFFGGGYKAINQRPLDKELQEYCLNDVRYMPRLYKRFATNIGEEWAQKVEQETLKRIALARDPSFKGGDQWVPSEWVDEEDSDWEL